MTNPHRLLITTAATTVLIGSVSLLARQNSTRDASDAQEAKRPKIVLRAQPSVAIAPARVVLTAELQGGADDFEEYYCPSIEWQWGDDTSSESSADCEPFEAGKSQIKRRFTVEHIFRRQGAHKVYFHMKRQGKTVGSAAVTVQIQPGGRDPDWH